MLLQEISAENPFSGNPGTEPQSMPKGNTPQLRRKTLETAHNPNQRPTIDYSMSYSLQISMPFILPSPHPIIHDPERLQIMDVVSKYYGCSFRCSIGTVLVLTSPLSAIHGRSSQGFIILIVMRAVTSMIILSVTRRVLNIFLTCL